MSDMPDARLVLMGRRQMTPGERFRAPPLPAAGWILLRCWRGRGTLRLGGINHALTPGRFLWLATGGEGELVCDRSGMLLVTGALLTGRWPGPDRPATRQGDLADHPVLTGLLDACQALSLRGAIPEWQARLLGGLLLHEMAHGGAGAGQDVLRGVRRLLDDHPGQRLTPGDLAAMLKTSPTTLGRMFRQTAKCSPRAWLDQRLVERAAGQLVEGDDTVAEIAARAGFTDATVFTRLFSRLMGESPSAYRRRNRLW